jgi:hypothetical protein
MYQVQPLRYLVEVERRVVEGHASFPDIAALASALAQPVQRDEQNVRFIRPS